MKTLTFTVKKLSCKDIDGKPMDEFKLMCNGYTIATGARACLGPMSEEHWAAMKLSELFGTICQFNFPLDGE